MVCINVCLCCRWRWPFWSTLRHWHYKWRLLILWTQARLAWRCPASSPGRLNPRALMSGRYWQLWHHCSLFSVLLFLVRTSSYINVCFVCHRQPSQCWSPCSSSTPQSSPCSWQLCPRRFRTEPPSCFRTTWRTLATLHRWNIQTFLFAHKQRSVLLDIQGR